MDIFDRDTINLFAFIVLSVIGYFVSSNRTTVKIAASAATTQAVQDKTSLMLADAICRLDDETVARVAAQKQVDALRGQLTADSTATAAYRATTDAHILAQTTRLDLQTKAIDKLTDQVADLRGERDTLRTERDTSRDQVVSLSNKLDAAKERLAIAEKQIADLTIEKQAFELLLKRLDITLVFKDNKEIKPDEPVAA